MTRAGTDPVGLLGRPWLLAFEVLGVGVVTLPQTMTLPASGWDGGGAPSVSSLAVSDTMEIAGDNRGCPKPSYNRPTSRSVKFPLNIRLFFCVKLWTSQASLTQEGALLPVATNWQRQQDWTAG